MADYKTPKRLIRYFLLCHPILLVFIIVNFSSNALEITDKDIESYTISRTKSPKISIPFGISTVRSSTLDFDPDRTTALMGSGFDAVSSSVKGDCVDRSVGRTTLLPDKEINQRGQAVRYTAIEISSLSELRSVLNVSASASFSYGIYSGGGSFKLLEDDTINSFSSYMFISMEVTNFTEVLSEKKLLPIRVTQLTNNRDEFLRSCGSEFVSGLVTGGLFTALVKFETRSEEHKRTMSAAINGAIAGFGEASGTAKDRFSSLEKLSSFSILIIRKGDSGALPDLTALETYATEFSDKVMPDKKPWVFKALTASYDTVDNPVTGVASHEYEHQNFYLDILAQQRDSAVQLRNDLLYAYANPDQFEGDTRNELQTKINKINAYILDIFSLANECKASPLLSCSDPKKIPELPTLNKPIRISSSAAGILRQAEALYDKRSDMRMNDAALALLTQVDEATATLDERYHAALLTAEALRWKANHGIELFWRNAYDSVLSQAIDRAIGLALAMPTKPCEADYLSALRFYRTTDINADMWRNLIALVDPLQVRVTRTGTDCTSYDWNGVSRLRGMARLGLTGYWFAVAEEVPPEAMVARALIKEAFDFQPDHPLNVYLWYKLNGCDIIKEYASRSTPGVFAVLEPHFSESKRTVISMSSLGGGASTTFSWM